MFLYYDHMHHTWVFNNELELRKPQPLAFLAHGAILPISKRSDRTFRKYGAPKSVHWIVRDIVSGDSRPDGTIKVEGKITQLHTTQGAHLLSLSQHLANTGICAEESITNNKGRGDGLKWSFLECSANNSYVSARGDELAYPPVWCFTCILVLALISA